MRYDFPEYALLMKALSDETRLRILYMLTEGELCACRILEEFKITQPTLSHHMKTLKARGLVRSRKDGAWTKYTLNEDRIDTIREFFGDLRVKEDATPQADMGGCKKRP